MLCFFWYHYSLRIWPILLSREKHSLFLASLLGGLGNLACSRVLLSYGFDDTDGNGLPHVTDSKTSERSILRESLNAHGLAGLHDNNGSISRLDLLGVILKLLARTTIDLLNHLLKLAGNMGCVAIQYRAVSLADLSRVVKDDDLSLEVLSSLGGVILVVRADISTTDLLD